MRILLVIFAGLVVFAVVLAIAEATAAPRPDRPPTPLTKRIDRERAKTFACQQQLGLKRSPVSSRPIYSAAYARWVLRLWETREQAFCAALKQVRYLTAFTPVDELADAKAWANSAAGRCVSSHEGAVTSNTGNGYYGKWQADISFQLAYGREFYERWGVASNWPAWAQNVMAYRGWRARGWAPWPTTSVMCGVR